MAIFYCDFSILSRIDPHTQRTQSAVASSAYKAREKLRHFEASAAAAYIAGGVLETRGKGKIHNYSRKGGVVFSGILLPEKAPAHYGDRQKLWNAVELAEKRKDAQLARQFIGALPVELSHEQQVELVYDYALTNFVENGMIVDYSIHDPDFANRNPHVHMMFTTREVTAEGFGKKNRDWNKKQHLLSWREDWARVQNRYLQQAGYDLEQVGVDHRSYSEQGSGLKGQYHEGKETTRLRRRGILTDVAQLNEEIKAYNMAYTKEIERAKREVTSQLTADFERKIGALYRQLQDRTAKQNTASAPSLPKKPEPIVLYNDAQYQLSRNSAFDVRDKNTFDEDDLLIPDQELQAKPTREDQKKESEPIGELSSLDAIRAEYIAQALQIAAARKTERHDRFETEKYTSWVEDLTRRGGYLTQFHVQLKAIKQQDMQLTGLAWEQRQLLDEKKLRVTEAERQAIVSLKIDYGIRPDQIAAKRSEFTARLEASKEKQRVLVDFDVLERQLLELEQAYAKAVQSSKPCHEPFVIEDPEQQATVREADRRLAKAALQGKTLQGREKARDTSRDQNITF